MPHSAVPDEVWSPTPGDAGAPVQLPGYRDFVLVASGGESTVYRARQEGLDRLVAVKVLSPDPDGAGSAVASRFQRELEITVRLGRAHPHIVTVLDTQMTPDGRPCIVMEYYDLGSLHDQLRAHGPLPASAAVAAGTVVADALAYAHAQGVLHRDVKPQNILVLPTSYVLADFGLARHMDAGHSVSLERFSYRHASPQVLDGELPTVADDIYSLGSTLFTLLDGRPPFATDDAESDTALAYLRRVRSERPRPIRSSDASPQLLTIIDRCLAKAREDRYPDAKSLRAALAAISTEVRMWSPRVIRPDTSTDEQRPPAAGHAGPAMAAPAATRHWATEAPARHRPGAGGGAPGQPPPPPAMPMPQHAAPPLPAPEPAAPAPAAPLPPPRGPQLYAPITFSDPDASADEPVDEGSGRRRGMRVTLLALAALVLGTALGLGVPRLLTATPAAAPDGVARTVPTYTGVLPTAGPAPVDDPAIAPEITALDDRGSAIELRWSDPTNGQAIFVVVQVDGDEGQLLLQVDPGTSSVVINEVDPAVARYCYQILAIAGNRKGVSPVRCTDERG